MPELAAYLATVLAGVAAVPQLRRLVARGDCAGVSITSAALGIATELAWVGYTAAEGLWSALPEAAMMAIANVAITATLVRRGIVAGRAAMVAGAWLAGLGAVAAIGGLHLLGVVLGAAYGVQVAPAVWTVWRTPSPTGVAASTWTLVGIEGALWFAYGLHRGDPATTSLGVLCVVTSTAVVVRMLVVRRRSAIEVGGIETERRGAVDLDPALDVPLGGLRTDRGELAAFTRLDVADDLAPTGLAEPEAAVEDHQDAERGPVVAGVGDRQLGT